jgi:hypothetical protein
MAMHLHPVTDDGPRCRHTLIRRSFCIYSSTGGGWPQSERSRNLYDVMFYFFTPTHTVCAVIPGSYRNKAGKPQYDWNFSTVGAPFCVHPRPNLRKGASNEWEIYELGTVRSAHSKSIIGHPTQYRGKGLGGSSSINSFLFHRPSTTDINGVSSLKCRQG